MQYYGKQQGYVFERDLFVELSKVLKDILAEDDIKKKYGMCESDGKLCIGVDILCTDNKYIYAIQCKQVMYPTATTQVKQFIDYCKYLEQIIRVPIIKIWATSVNPYKPGIDIGDNIGVTWITFPTTINLIKNVVSWIIDRRTIIEDDGDYTMENCLL